MTTFMTQSTDISSGGLEFDTNDEVWTIEPNVLVADATSDCVASSWINSSIFNYGSIFSGAYDGVHFDNTGANLFNEPSASIAGPRNGVYARDNGVGIENFGSITGYANAGVYLNPSTNNIFLSNADLIYGHNSGIYSNSQNSGGIFINSGMIMSDGAAMDISTRPGLTTTIFNNSTGVIKGSVVGIAVFDGNFSLTNHGVINGGIDHFTSLDNVIINTGKIQGTTYFGGGNDVFNGKGGTSGPIFAGGGNDRIIGGKGNVAIHVGGGNDTLTAGPGNDQFIFDSALTGQVDKITNFKHGPDKIVLSETDFAGLGPPGQLHAAHFHLNHAGPSASPADRLRARERFPLL